MDRPPPGVRGRAAAGALLALACLAQPPLAAAAQQGRESCPNGVVERVEIQNGPVFPTNADNPRVMRWIFGAANRVRITTTRSFIRRELLFAVGDCYDAFLVSESRRVLDAYGFIDQVQVETVEGNSGGKVVRIRTQDRWSTQLDLGATYDAGVNVEHFSATETNFLGNGILAEVTHNQRRERQVRHVRLASPRLFGRTDVDLRVGSTSAGPSVYHRVNHGFVGEASRWSWTESIEQTTYFQSYATGGAAAFSHVLVPMTRNGAEVAAGIRLGEPGRSWILGLALDRTVYRQNGDYEFVQNGDFDGAKPGVGVVAPGVARQTASRGATRIVLHWGVRRLRYVDQKGLDAFSDVRIVPAGFEGSVSVGRSMRILVPERVDEAGDSFVRSFVGFTKVGELGVLRLNAYGEAGNADASWRDMLGYADGAVWLRAPSLPAHTLFLRAAAGGAWRTTVSFQLDLGGRDGVRALPDDEHPGGRRVVFTAEDRIRFPWPTWSGLELGATLFADAGRMWPGDVPYGSDDGWRAGAGFGLRVVVPRGSSQVLKPEIAFPVGRPGAPVFRVTAELNSVSGWLSTPRVSGSRRFWRGAEHY